MPSHLNRHSEQPPASGGSEKGLLQTPGARPALMDRPRRVCPDATFSRTLFRLPRARTARKTPDPCAQRRSPSKRRGQSSSFATNAERPDLPELDSETKGTEAYCPRATGSSAPRFLPSTEFVDVGCRPGARGRHGRALPPELRDGVTQLLAPSARPLRGRGRGFRWNRGGCSSPLRRVVPARFVSTCSWAVKLEQWASTKVEARGVAGLGASAPLIGGHGRLP